MMDATSLQLTKEAALELSFTALIVIAAAVIGLGMNYSTCVGCFNLTGIRSALRRTASVVGDNRKVLPPTVQKSFFLPHMQGTSDVIGRQLNHLGIHIVHKPASSLRAALTPIKDATSNGR